MEGKKNRIISLGLSGATGRMGRTVKTLCVKDKYIEILEEIPPLKNFSKGRSQGKIGAVIDFSSPELFSKSLKYCVQYKKPFLSGTTGLNISHEKAMKEASQYIPVFYESNMSFGIWLFQNWIKYLQKLRLPAFSILLEDIHHRYKKDKPSGTALKLKNSFSKDKQKKVVIKSYRRGKEFGTHKLYLKGKEEEVLMQHKALNRLIFARGALEAIKYLVCQKPGFYKLDHMYSFKKVYK